MDRDFPLAMGLAEARAHDWAPELQKTRVYEQILLDIILGLLPPNSPVDEKTLAARYGAGLAGVRDALGRLALEGLVVRRARIGTTIAPLDLREIEQAFEVRRLLEGRCAALAAQNATPRDVELILGAFEHAEAAIAAGDFRALLAMDRDFHRAVAYATQNVILARFIISLQNIATRFWVFNMERESAEEQLADVDLHRALAQAIAAHDPAGAEAAMSGVVGEPPSAYPLKKRGRMETGGALAASEP